MTGDRVLLVDDEEIFVETLAKRMSARGLTVDTAENGEVALDKVKAGEFDVIVLDLAMPGINGIETLKRVREIDPEVQVILLTGHGSISTGVEAMKMGATDFLEKPANFQELFELVKEAGKKKVLLIEKRRAESLEKILGEHGW